MACWPCDLCCFLDDLRVCEWLLAVDLCAVDAANAGAKLIAAAKIDARLARSKSIQNTSLRDFLDVLRSLSEPIETCQQKRLLAPMSAGSRKLLKSIA